MPVCLRVTLFRRSVRAFEFALYRISYDYEQLPVPVPRSGAGAPSRARYQIADSEIAIEFLVSQLELQLHGMRRGETTHPRRSDRSACSCSVFVRSDLADAGRLKCDGAIIPPHTQLVLQPAGVSPDRKVPITLSLGPHSYSAHCSGLSSSTSTRAARPRRAPERSSLPQDR